jgi:hypothetical protein
VKGVAQEILFQECPLCDQSAVTYYDEGVYRCPHCGLTLKNRTLLGLFRKGRFTVTSLGQGQYDLAWSRLKRAALPPGRLKVVLGNVYTDQQLAEIAGGALELIRPVRTMLAQIILEQLKETCYLQVNGLQRGHGAPLSSSSFRPVQPVPRSGMSWQDQGNLFCTQQRLVFPSDSFTFIRLDRKLAAVQAFTNGVAVQRAGEDYATYFVGCWPHEAALVAAYLLGKLPQLREAAPELIEHK